METRNYPQYAAIEHHIRRAQISRAVVIAEVLAESIVGSWNALKAVPAFLASDRRRAWRNSFPQTGMARR